MLQNRIVSLLILLVLILGHHQSDAKTPLGRIRKLSRFLADVNTKEIPPAPSPDSDVGNGKDSTGSDKCLSSQSCSIKKLTACLRYSGNDLKEVFLIVENTGESPIQVNVTFAPANTISEISLTKQGVKEVNVTEKVQGRKVVVLSASNGSCQIRMKSSSSSVLSGWKLPYATITLTPVYGVYMLFAAFVIVGGVWGCCKFGRSERRVEGIPYQELEMSQVEDSNINNNVETAQDGWGETWDDDWDNDDGEDEIREVKSPRSKANGHTSRQQRSANNTDGDAWVNNWDD